MLIVIILYQRQRALHYTIHRFRTTRCLQASFSLCCLSLRVFTYQSSHAAQYPLPCKPVSRYDRFFEKNKAKNVSQSEEMDIDKSTTTASVHTIWNYRDTPRERSRHQGEQTSHVVEIAKMLNDRSSQKEKAEENIVTSAAECTHSYEKGEEAPPASGEEGAADRRTPGKIRSERFSDDAGGVGPGWEGYEDEEKDWEEER